MTDQTIEPMTAAEARKLVVWPYGTSERILAALEERERLLGERAKWRDVSEKAVKEVFALETDAALGALVRRIREHPKNRDRPYPIRPFGCDSVFSIDAAGLTAFLRHLDSLLPKEPEVAPSGWRYERADKFVRQIDHEGGTLVIRRADSDAVPPIDREFVAALLARQEGKDAK